jgi:diguanylate cyclase (GGDEF)-like protein
VSTASADSSRSSVTTLPQAQIGGLRARRGLGIVGVAATLVVLMVVTILGSFATDRSAARTRRSVVLSDAYEKAATGVAAEESLERKYRLEPGPVPLAGHRAAQQAVRNALADVIRLGNSRDQTLATTLLADHALYVDAAMSMFAAVDRHESSATVNAIDGRTVDPVFGVLQSEIYASAAHHQSQAISQIAALRRTSRLVLILDLATLVAGVALIVIAGTALMRSRRRLETQSDLNRHQALHDSLTGLPNRTLFQDRTAQALKAAQRSGDQIAVLVIDLDRFKDINDTLGHQYGDVLLSQVASRFHHTLRGGDSVARLGGDEFAVLLCATSADDAISAAERLTESLLDPFTVKDISLDVEASIGIALAASGSDMETTLRHADVAMYEAKSQHLPYASYALTRDDNTVSRLALLGDLRRAISNGELTLDYQPKISTATGEVHSVEALVRWHHPLRGLLMPDAFIPIAESTAVIHPLTEEILRQALLQTRAWLERGWTIAVAVNISARSLHDLSFAAKVQHQLETIGVPASQLSLELTEGAIMVDPERALAALNELNAMGISLSIDDFGTGYSSMSYLKDLPVRELKIDRSFVIGMSGYDGDRVIVQSAVDLGHNLGLHVVAEGVEDKETQDALWAMGCDLLQGYYIRRPASAVALEPWLATHAAAGVTSTMPSNRVNSAVGDSQI